MSGERPGCSLYKYSLASQTLSPCASVWLARLALYIEFISSDSDRVMSRKILEGSYDCPESGARTPTFETYYVFHKLL